MGDQRFLSAAENCAHELVEPAAVGGSTLLSLCSAHISNLLAASTDSSVLPEHQLVRLEQALTIDALDLRLRESRSSLFAIGSSRPRRPVRLEGRFLIVAAVEPDPKTGDTKIHPHADELNLKRNGIARGAVADACASFAGQRHLIDVIGQVTHRGASRLLLCLRQVETLTSVAPLQLDIALGARNTPG